MPELPEVETVRRGLQAQVVGRRIHRVEVGRERTVRRTSRQAVIDGLTGATITRFDRRGKYLLGVLDTGDEVMMHLRMSGRLLVAAAGTERPAHTHVVMHLEGEPAEELWFIDPRTFGEIVVFDPSNVAVEVPELALMGVDPVADGLSRDHFAAILRARSRQIKALLLDQHVIAGIGNIYCDEALHLAKVRWDRRSDAVSPREITRLHTAIMQVLNDAIESGGSTLADTQYVGVDGESGWFQLHHRVYDRDGQRCLTCGKADIVKVFVAGRAAPTIAPAVNADDTIARTGKVPR